MSLQWTLIAGLLYIEIAIIFIMLLSLIKPHIWRKLFQSRFAAAIVIQSNLYLYAFIGILLLFFGESVREFYKYSGKLRHGGGNYGTGPGFYEDQMRLFRGQRNFYISGFALFSLFIIKRLASFISEIGKLQLQGDALALQIKRNQANAHLLETLPSAPPADDSFNDNTQSENQSANLKLSNSGDTLNGNEHVKGQISELEQQIQNLREEATKWKDQAETAQVEMEELKTENKILKAKCGTVEESRKDK